MALVAMMGVDAQEVTQTLAVVMVLMVAGALKAGAVA